MVKKYAADENYQVDDYFDISWINHYRHNQNKMKYKVETKCAVLQIIIIIFAKEFFFFFFFFFAFLQVPMGVRGVFRPPVQGGSSKLISNFYHLCYCAIILHILRVGKYIVVDYHPIDRSMTTWSKTNRNT